MRKENEASESELSPLNPKQSFKGDFQGREGEGGNPYLERRGTSLQLSRWAIGRSGSPWIRYFGEVSFTTLPICRFEMPVGWVKVHTY